MYAINIKVTQKPNWRHSETRHKLVCLPPLSVAAGAAVGEQVPTFQPVLEAVLQHHEELLQGREVGVQGPAQAQGRLDQDFDTELHHVHEVGALLHGVVPRTWGWGDTGGERKAAFSNARLLTPHSADRSGASPARSPSCGGERLEKSWV